MKWAMISIATSHAGVEGAANFLWETGVAGVEIEDPLAGVTGCQQGLWDYADLPTAADRETVIVKAYLPAHAATPEVIDSLRRRMVALKACGIDTGTAQVSCRQVDDADWTDQWRRYFHTHKVGEKLVIKPSWEKYRAAPGEVVLALDPGAAFGTGLHASTTLCLRCLEKFITPGAVVLDVGTGSGILAVAAAKLGAVQVVALDHDPLAVQTARDNVFRNGLSGRIDVRQSDLLQRAESVQAQVVVANIVADVVMRLAPAVPAHLVAGGRFIAGGIITERLTEVTAVIASCGFLLEDVVQERGWAAVVATRQP